MIQRRGGSGIGSRGRGCAGLKGRLACGKMQRVAKPRVVRNVCEKIRVQQGLALQDIGLERLRNVAGVT